MPLCLLASAAVVAFLLAAAGARAETAHPGGAGHHAPAVHAPAARRRASGHLPTLPGQDAFGAVQEIVRILLADPATRS